jgi:DNA (cytosine-5)-methyltransferase 1
VFVVGCAGDHISAAKVLFERENVFRNPSSRGAAGQTVARTIAARSGESRNNPEQLVAYDQQRQWQYGDGEVASTKAARDFKDATDLIVIDRAAFNQGANAMYPPHIGQTNVMDPLVARGPHAVAIQGTVIGRQDHNGPNSSGCSDGGEMFTLTSTDVHAVAIVGQVDWRTANNDQGQVSQTLKTDLAHQSGPCLAVAPTMQVRRLTPTECERLQGFPDGWTAIPWKKKSAEDCPDGPRYKALGNSMAVNCMAWIGERISEVEAKR